MTLNISGRKAGRSAVVAIVTAIMVMSASGFADARPGGKSSFGSRGSRTFEAAPTTRTAPTTAQPIQRSQTTPSQAQAGQAAAASQAAQPTRSRFGGGFFAGLLGAGLLGALFGAGLFGGLGSLASIMGFVLQLALIAGLVFLVMQFFRRRQQPATAGAGAEGPMQRSSLGGLTPPTGGLHAAGGSAPSIGVSPSRAHQPTEKLLIGPEDYAEFERALHEIQMAYGREDVAALWERATPEMAGYLQEELNENARTGVQNVISEVKLLQGDLSEAWRENATEYATVAMRFGLREQTIDRKTNQVISGDLANFEEVTEVWTFRRDAGGSWKLSAIQQAH